ncbi:unnamed protein product, partial [Adineta ricciae]
MTYSTEVRGGHGLTILVPTTGDQWPSLLEHFIDGSKTNGLYERFLYWTIGKKNFIQENSILNNELPSIEYLYVTRMLIGTRVYEYENEVIDYLRPILSSMRNNHATVSGLFAVPSNIRAEACERRGADLVERIAVVFQNIFDTLRVLEPIKSIQFETIKKTTLDDITRNIKSVFYSNE